MYVEDIKKYEGKKILLILSNKFKYTTILPKIERNTFTIKDKYGHLVTINCELVHLITEVD